MDLLPALSSAAGYALGGPTGALIGAQIGGTMSTNDTRAQIAADANAFSANQYATRYQTQVKDMEAAGLNPMLAYMQSPGASPVGQQYQVSNPYEGLANTYSSAYNVQRSGENIDADTVLKRAESYLKEAQTSLAGASADQSRAVTNKLEFEAKKIAEEIKNIPSEGERIRALVDNLRASESLIKSQSATEVERANQMKWLALKTMLESDLLTLDVKAADSLDNLGRMSKEGKVVLDILKMLTRR